MTVKWLIKSFVTFCLDLGSNTNINFCERVLVPFAKSISSGNVFCRHLHHSIGLGRIPARWLSTCRQKA